MTYQISQAKIRGVEQPIGGYNFPFILDVAGGHRGLVKVSTPMLPSLVARAKEVNNALESSCISRRIEFAMRRPKCRCVVSQMSLTNPADFLGAVLLLAR